MGIRVLYRQIDLKLFVFIFEDGKIFKRCVEKWWLECLGELEIDNFVFMSLWERSDDCDQIKIM